MAILTTVRPPAGEHRPGPSDDGDVNAPASKGCGAAFSGTGSCTC